MMSVVFRSVGASSAKSLIIVPFTPMTFGSGHESRPRTFHTCGCQLSVGPLICLGSFLGGSIAHDAALKLVGGSLSRSIGFIIRLFAFKYAYLPSYSVEIPVYNSSRKSSGG